MLPLLEEAEFDKNNAESLKNSIESLQDHDLISINKCEKTNKIPRDSLIHKQVFQFEDNDSMLNKDTTPQSSFDVSDGFFCTNDSDIKTKLKSSSSIFGTLRRKLKTADSSNDLNNKTDSNSNKFSRPLSLFSNSSSMPFRLKKSTTTTNCGSSDLVKMNSSSSSSSNLGRSNTFIKQLDNLRKLVHNKNTKINKDRSLLTPDSNYHSDSLISTLPNPDDSKKDNKSITSSINEDNNSIDNFIKEIKPTKLKNNFFKQKKQK
jgi:hypothetical protein